MDEGLVRRRTAEDDIPSVRCADFTVHEPHYHRPPPQYQTLRCRGRSESERDTGEPRSDCPFCGTEADPGAFLNCGSECREAGEHTQEPGCFYVGAALEPCCPRAPYRFALLAAREVLSKADEVLSVRRLRGGVTVIRWTSGTAYMEVGLEREPLALLTEDERARLDRLEASDG